MSRRVALERGLASGSVRRALVDHEQRVVARARAHLDALGAALAVDRVDEDPEGRRLEAAPRRHVAVLLVVWTKWDRARRGGDVRLGLAGGERRDRARRAPTRARRCQGSRVSGQALTQAMQPTQRSAMNCGSRGASRLKSRVAAVPGRDDAARQRRRRRASSHRRRRAGRPARPTRRIPRRTRCMSNTGAATRGAPRAAP